MLVQQLFAALAAELLEPFLDIDHRLCLLLLCLLLLCLRLLCLRLLCLLMCLFNSAGVCSQIW